MALTFNQKMEVLKEVASKRGYSLEEITEFLNTCVIDNPRLVPSNPVARHEAPQGNFTSPVVIDFLAEEGAVDTTQYADGVYLCYADGHKELFTDNNPKENATHIGIKMFGVAFGLQLRDKGTYQLLRNGVRCPEHASHYTRNNKRNAFEDCDYKTATKRIQDLGTDIPLADGEYLPTLGLWGRMMLVASTIQDALEYVGGDKLTDEDWYASVTEYSQYYAWVVYFNDGNTGSNYKSGTYRVRAVVAF